MIDWIALEKSAQLESLEKESLNKTIVLFKHSTRCGMSLHAKEKLESSSSILRDKADFYYLDLLNYREVSTEIAQRYKVIHQSPQLIVLKNGKVSYHISHGAIEPNTLVKEL
ncbi:MAG: bacillithiol system redox-active protein YtxJ [Chitinophagales bacterium]|nr:bacillithiol system redox-active protein YtxJ [Chitinophagales bacterium]